MAFKGSAVGVHYHFVVYLSHIVSIFCSKNMYQEYFLLRCDAIYFGTNISMCWSNVLFPAVRQNILSHIS